MDEEQHIDDIKIFDKVLSSDEILKLQNNIVLKKCKKCGIEKELSEFRKQARSKDGLISWCKVCQDQKSKEYYLANKTRKIVKSLVWQEKNPEKVKTYIQNFKEKHKSPPTS